MANEVKTEIEIDAPVSRVWALLQDIEHYKSWNRIFNFTHANLKPGGRGILWARVGPAVTPLPVRFDVVEPECELRWHGGLQKLGYGSHYLRLEALPDDRTLLTHGEEFSGLLFNASWKLLGKQLPGAYKAFNKALVRELA